MRVWLGASLMGLLAGCSLPTALAPGKPNVSELTGKTPKDYAQCVLPAWQRETPRSTQSDISNGYRITAPGSLASDEVVEVVKSKNGSLVSLYQGTPWAKSAVLKKAVHDCL
ncbi:hypothetical protein [Pseudomonas chlororaphis]|uniref:hypothetical protein n=1 Tax=Pseudomonas chlororaphis TaxID=587753 RepID=UPI0006A630BC|nr:hypothetical protein [Pseudomonas chlororaphis]AZD03189.1 hypothetical protein C4K27_3999 [Pseudomonas chlororaphis subsp. chlororaphis]MBM0282677.1 hypothetical protein [Pseudomonas chlororaphis]MDO1506689.1 hypothetical protein [Pseudomonas chlororaphis]ORM45781.1 hypothetical protein B6D51_23355 [Pseudomonas chlororaphis subsp. chlororaphis]TWR91668.1 hypothetical protein FJD36_23665 [Pseudomonas chlororaphis subsp. chlororaphis]